MFITPSSSSCNLDRRQGLEVKLLAFYRKIFAQEVPSDARGSRHFKRNLQRLKAAYYARGTTVGCSSAPGLNFHRAELRCLYIFQHAACHASVVAHHYRNLLRLNPWLMQKTLLADSVKICIVGGGPASEMVAMAEVLEELLWRYCPRGDRPLVVDATVVNINSGWLDTVRRVDAALQRGRPLTRCRMSFVRADLAGPELDPELVGILEKCDIFTFVKRMDSLRDREDILRTLEAIVRHMPDDGIFFFVDSHGFRHHDVLATVTSGLQPIYGMWESERYPMSDAFVVECCRLYRALYFPGLHCCLDSRYYAGAWRKTACRCSESVAQDPNTHPVS